MFYIYKRKFEKVLSLQVRAYPIKLKISKAQTLSLYINIYAYIYIYIYILNFHIYGHLISWKILRYCGNIGMFEIYELL